MGIHRVKNKVKFTEGIEILSNFEKAYLANKEASSVFGKAKTQVKNFFKAFVAEEGIPAISAIDIDGVSYTFKASESNILDPRKWHALFVAGEINEDQYFGALNVVKEDAKLAIGEDQCLAIQVKVSGKTADVRRDDSEAGHRQGVSVIVPDNVTMGVVKRTAPKAELQAPAKTVRRLVVLGKPKA